MVNARGGDAATAAAEAEVTHIQARLDIVLDFLLLPADTAGVVAAGEIVRSPLCRLGQTSLKRSIPQLLLFFVDHVSMAALRYQIRGRCLLSTTISRQRDKQTVHPDGNVDEQNNCNCREPRFC